MVAYYGQTLLSPSPSPTPSPTLSPTPSPSPYPRPKFYEHLPLRAYVIEMWNTRTEAGLGEGMDASRAHLLKFSRCVRT